MVLHQGCVAGVLRIFVWPHSGPSARLALILPNNVTTITRLHIEFDADQREKNATPTGGNDPDDAPELTEEFFAQVDEYVKGQWVRRGRPKGWYHQTFPDSRLRCGCDRRLLDHR